MLWMQPLKRYFEFSGRSSRAEFWQFMAAFVIALVVAVLIDEGSETSLRSGIPRNAFVILAIGIIPAYAAAFRRLHDCGTSGWTIGFLWMFNIAGLIIGKIKDVITIEILAAPFVLVFWAILFVQLGWGVYLVKELARRGDSDANRFGPPPEQ